MLEYSLYPALYWFSFATLFAGLVGFSSKPKYELERHERYLKAILTFYLISTFGMFLHALAHVMYGVVIPIELFLVITLLIASIYLMHSTGIEKFDIYKFKDAIEYGAVIWLMGKNLPYIPFFLDASIAMAVLSFDVLILTLYLFWVVRKKSVYFNFEDHELIVACTFFMVYITGISCLFINSSNIHFTLNAVSSAILIYIIYKLYVVTKPFLRDIYGKSGF